MIPIIRTRYLRFMKCLVPEDFPRSVEGSLISFPSWPVQGCQCFVRQALGEAMNEMLSTSYSIFTVIYSNLSS